MWLKATPGMRTDDSQAAILRSIDSIGELRMYFNSIEQRGINAQMAIDEGNAALDEFAGETH